MGTTNVDTLEATTVNATTHQIGGTSITATAAEINLIDGASATAPAASKAAILDSAGALRTAGNVGTAATGVTAVEYGDAYTHKTVLTLNTTLPAIAGGADLGVGKLIYTLPAGACVVHGSYMSVAITQSEGNITADTPDVGIGTTIASGANALLSAVGAAAENILTGQTAADCNGTATVKTVATNLVIESGDDHTVYLNAADGWAASGDSAATLTGTVVLFWSFMA